jgi:hypothetical protein
LDSILSQKTTIEDLLGTKQRINEPVPSKEEIEAFLDRKMNGLAEVIAGDPIRAKQEIHKRVEELKLRPIKTTDGRTSRLQGMSACLHLRTV